jgi:hypothetical protein
MIDTNLFKYVQQLLKDQGFKIESGVDEGSFGITGLGGLDGKNGHEAGYYLFFRDGFTGSILRDKLNEFIAKVTNWKSCTDKEREKHERLYHLLLNVDRKRKLKIIL